MSMIHELSRARSFDRICRSSIRVRAWLGIAALMVFSLELLVTSALAADARPNIVFIMVDDMGYGDLPAYGATDVRTRQLDRFAAQGVRLTSYYAAGANVLRLEQR
ncbi:MAG: sulfatase-like hydrolase/transferase [Rhodopirellula sp.]|nr:sulfatase-like hydrolase/transferase [Rhodopirellula sp.]